MTDDDIDRLAAILAADVAGYSRLMAADEEGTLAALKVWTIGHPAGYGPPGTLRVDREAPTRR